MTMKKKLDIKLQQIYTFPKWDSAEFQKDLQLTEEQYDKALKEFNFYVDSKINCE